MKSATEPPLSHHRRYAETKKRWARMDYARNPQKYRDRENARRHRPENRAKELATQFKANRTVHRRYCVLKVLAKKKGWQLELTKDEYIQFVKDNFCYYCRGPLSPTGHGVDRVDNRLGYTKKNIVPCCGPCNTKKGCLEMAGFIFPRTVDLLRELNDRRE